MTLFLYLAVLAVGLTLFNILRARADYHRMQEREFLWWEARHKAAHDRLLKGMRTWR